MKVLAYRSNRIFVVAPIVVVVCFLLTSMIFYFRRGSVRIGRYNWHIIGAAWSLAVAMAAAFIERLCMPKVLIEYDDCGLYIYKYRRGDPILLRYEQIINHHFEVDVGSENMTFSGMSQEQVGFVSKNAIGTLCIRVDGEDIKVRGIKNVKQVSIELNKQIKAFKEKENNKIERYLEQLKREKELEELAKHDINT